MAVKMDRDSFEHDKLNDGLINPSTDWYIDWWLVYIHYFRARIH